MPRELLIQVPALPDKRLGPNASRYCHWGTKAKLRSELKQTVLMAAKSARLKWEKENKTPWVPLVRATLKIRIFVHDRRKVMDKDNARGCLKAGQDVLQKTVRIKATGGVRTVSGAGIIVNDKNIEDDPIEFVVNPRVPECMYWHVIASEYQAGLEGLEGLTE